MRKEDEKIRENCRNSLEKLRKFGENFRKFLENDFLKSRHCNLVLHKLHVEQSGSE